ncbi:ubiquinol-cytochrome C chaperone-domain-containing protein [Pyronema domesticum]|uniref:Similar to CBP3-like protein acc. no. Q9USK6 n=1 Tax=Pyronema omphalodes (strain CBS 100304) TaxID=1076935 RepID=U4KVL4_PYROM|nr:ubiquinol-cytochrome C chaperone-domain-containing protein [Pyronema domesticum]CCX05643.1 Similar to CBP3-like protein; acc. no. Q9USK6 [Pyronema omphalodes CBS 100304]
MASRAFTAPLRLVAQKGISIPAVRPAAARLLTTTATPLQAITPADPGAPVNPAAPLAPNVSALNQNLSIADKIALRFKDYLPNTTETYVAFDVTKELYTECALQAAYVDGVDFTPSAKFWYETCNRPPTFQSWSQVTVLHMWMLAARMRALDKGRVKTWQQHFIDHFFYDSEDKMVKRYGIKRASERGGYMKDLYHQYRGMTAAFDEGLVKGDAVMATAIWRNVFSAQEDVDLEVLATVTSYVRRAVSKLSMVDDDVVLTGRVKFGMPTDELPLVRQKSSFLEGQKE